MSVRKKRLTLVGVLLLILFLFAAAYFVLTVFSAATGSVAIVSEGDEYERFAHFHFIRGSCGLVAGGMPKEPEEIADELIPIPLGEDFQIIIRGRPRLRPRYYFHRLVDNEWERALAVYTGSTFIDLLEPGGYIL